MKNTIIVKEEVKDALVNNKPVIALESTLIAHGFPYPENLELAIEIENLLRKERVIPATIAIIRGKVKVGLSRDELEYIASSNKIRKASLRDIPVLQALKLSGGTTVAGTMKIADMVGIKVFVTGGIGGVHRHGENTLDISADLQALSRYNVLVVSAGAKSVLDLPRTREVLETLGVPVLGYKTEEFPAFYKRKSGLKVDYRVNSPEEVVSVLNYQNEGGVLLTTPIPEEEEIDLELYEKTVKELLEEVEEKGINGKDVTPYLLAELGKRTKGESIRANKALIRNNLKAGCKVARAYYQGD